MPDSGRHISDEPETRSRRLNLHEVDATPTDDRGEGIYRGVGAELQAERERYGLLLSEVGERLRIRVPYLEAIEAGKFGDLPGRIYAIGFLRSYAEFLGADGDVCVQMFKDEAGAGGHSRRLEFPVPQNENRRPGTATLLIAVLLGAAVYGGWFFLNGQDDQVVDLVPAVPERIARQITPDTGRSGANAGADTQADPTAAATSGGVIDGEVIDGGVIDGGVMSASAADARQPLTAIDVATVNVDTNSLAAGTVSSTPDGNTAAEAVIGEPIEQRGIAAIASTVTSTVTSTATGTLAATDAAEAAIVEQDTSTDAAGADAPVAIIAAIGPPPLPPSAPRAENVPRVFGVANTDARIVIRATDRAQILVKQAGGRTVLPHRVLQAGDEYRAPDLDGLLIRSDNVAGLRLFVDGKDLGSVAHIADSQNNLALDANWLLANAGSR